MTYQLFLIVFLCRLGNFTYVVVVVVVYLMSTLSPLQVEEIFGDSCFMSVYHMSQMPGGKDVSSGQT